MNPDLMTFPCTYCQTIELSLICGVLYYSGMMDLPYVSFISRILYYRYIILNQYIENKKDKCKNYVFNIGDKVGLRNISIYICTRKIYGKTDQ